VLTNSIKVAMELSGKKKVDVISTGGMLRSESLSYVGPLAERSLELYHVNKAFLSCQGIHLQRGISDSNEMQALVKQRMLNMADQVFLMADYSKFGRQAFAHIGGFDQIDILITDSKTEKRYTQELQEHSVKVIQVG
jgi:DeoR family transcriptional regulator, L-fucose operon activator